MRKFNGEWDKIMELHALPEAWEAMAYDDVRSRRRQTGTVSRLSGAN